MVHGPVADTRAFHAVRLRERMPVNWTGRLEQWNQTQGAVGLRLKYFKKKIYNEEEFSLFAIHTIKIVNVL